MIFYSEEAISTKQGSNIVEVSVDGGFLYVELAVYEQAVLLNDRFIGSYETLYSQLTGQGTGFHKKDAELFFSHVPAPLGVLGAYFAIVAEDVELKTMEEACGMLHQISMVLDFNSFAKLSFDVRKNVVFGRRALEAWQRGVGQIEATISGEMSTNIVSRLLNIVAEVAERLPETIDAAMAKRPFFIQAYPVGDVGSGTIGQAPLNDIRDTDDNLEEYLTEDGRLDIGALLDEAFNALEDEAGSNANVGSTDAANEETVQDESADTGTTEQDDFMKRIEEMYGGGSNA